MKHSFIYNNYTERFHVKHMNYKGILFDFNGTLFFDSDINEIAWRQTVDELSNKTIDFDSVYKQYKSVRNALFVEKLFELMNKEVSEEEIKYWAKRKETEYYHKYVYEHNRKDLSPGAERFLNELKQNNIPINLCTASIEENVDLYLNYLGLDRWFDKNVITYDDGSFESKKYMYIEGAKRIGLDVKDCLIFEDSYRPIVEAKEAGCKNFIAIKRNEIPAIPEIKLFINDFDDVNIERLNSL